MAYVSVSHVLRCPIVFAEYFPESHLSDVQVTVADVCLICSLLDFFTLVCGKKERAQFPVLETYFMHCVAMPQFRAVLKEKGDKLCETSSNIKFSPPERVSAIQSKPAAQSKSSPSQAQGKSKENTSSAKAPAAKTSPAVAPVAVPGNKGTPEDQAALAAIKDKVRELKASGAAKEQIEAAVSEMKRLKDVCGEIDPPKKKKK